MRYHLGGEDEEVRRRDGWIVSTETAERAHNYVEAARRRRTMIYGGKNDWSCIVLPTVSLFRSMAMS